MKTLAALWFLLAVAVLQAGEPSPFVFSGVLHDGASTKVALTTSAGGESKWVNVGQPFGGYEIVSYDENSSTLLARRDGREFHIALQDAKIAPITNQLEPEVRGKIRSNLHQLWAAAQQYFLETGKTTAAFSDLVGDGKYIKSIEPISGEDYTSLVFSADAKSIAVRTSAGETVSFAEIFYAVKAGDGGAKIARANHLTLADLQALNPGVNWAKLRVGQVIKVSAEQK